MLLKLAEHLKPSKSLYKEHKGVVVDNEDPKKLGRVKCAISGFIEGDTELLPWVTPYGIPPNRFFVPNVGDELIIKFQESIYFPFYVGYWHNEVNKKTYFDEDYPNTFGIDDGIRLKYNKTKKEGTIEHESGSKALVKEDGTLELTLAKDLKLVISGDYIIGATGDIKFTPSGKFEVTATGDAKISSTAKAILEGTSGTDVGKASSVTNVKGILVNLAGGGLPIALLGGQTIGIGNLGGPVLSTIVDGSSKVFAAK